MEKDTEFIRVNPQRHIMEEYLPYYIYREERSTLLIPKDKYLRIFSLLTEFNVPTVLFDNICYYISILKTEGEIKEDEKNDLASGSSFWREMKKVLMFFKKLSPLYSHVKDPKSPFITRFQTNKRIESIIINGYNGKKPITVKIKSSTLSEVILEAIRGELYNTPYSEEIILKNSKTKANKSKIISYSTSAAYDLNNLFLTVPHLSIAPNRRYSLIGKLLFEAGLPLRDKHRQIITIEKDIKDITGNRIRERIAQIEKEEKIIKAKEERYKKQGLKINSKTRDIIKDIEGATE